MEKWWKHLAGCCHLTRDIPKLVQDGGFDIETIEAMYLPSTPRALGYNYWGAARAVHLFTEP